MSVLRITQEDYDRLQMKAGADALTKALKNAPRRASAANVGAIESKPPKRAKYGNVPTTDAQGVKHASKKQATRYRNLGLLMKSGEILMLAREVRFRLPGGIEYRADHLMANQRAIEVMAGLVASGDLVVEDVKSEATRNDKTYKLKARQMRECLGMEVREI